MSKSCFATKGKLSGNTKTRTKVSTDHVHPFSMDQISEVESIPERKECLFLKQNRERLFAGEPI